MRKAIDILLVLLSAFMWSCSEVYHPDDIEAADPIPVIQGIILENQAPLVKLTWTRTNGKEEPAYITGATVIVQDQMYNTCILDDIGGGEYYPIDDPMIGIVGNTYMLIVELPDGRVFNSTPQYLEAAPNLDSLYAAPVTTEIHNYNSRGEPIINKAQGLEVLADITEYGYKQYYYRFNTTCVKLSVKTVEMGTMSSHSVFMWETSTMDNSYTVDNTIKKGDTQLLLQHDLGFLHYFYNSSLETQSSTAPFTVAWAITFNVYSISSDVFEYYRSIGKQLESEDVIFAPIVSQVKSNIYCATDLSQKVTGVFEACSRTTVYKAFGWKSLTEYYSQNLDYFPENLGEGEQHYWEPFFWIYF